MNTEETEAFVVYYTKAPPTTSLVAGRLVDQALFDKVAPALAVSEFAQHDALHDEEVPVTVHVANARQQVPAPALHSDGFTLVPLATRNDNGENTRARLTREVAMQEAVQLVQAACPDCIGAIAFDVTYRNSARNNRNSNLGPGGWQSSDSAAVGRVHADYTPDSALAKIHALRHENPQVASLLADGKDLHKHDLAIINVWRPLGSRGRVVRHRPLGLLHPSSVRTTPFPYSLVYQNRAGTNASLAQDDAHHRWIYYKEMTPEEALLFYNFRQGRGAALAGGGTFHAALQETASREDDGSTATTNDRPPPRESVEVRVLVRWN